MSKRSSKQWLRAGLQAGIRVALLVAAVSTLSPAPVLAANPAGQGEVRDSIALDHGWRFRFGESPAAVTATGFDDSGWQPVTVPHTWNRVGNYGTTVAPDSNTERGIGWYRLAFDLPQQPQGRRHFLQFDAVATIAEVWVNGTRVGEHKGAYARFRFDVTELLKPGSNLIVVKADNSAAAPGSSTEHVLPLGGDYFLFGGIYRGVALISTDTAHIDMLDHGGPGVYVRTPHVSAARAEVEVRTRLRNAGDAPRDLQLVATVIDADGKPVASDRTPLSLARMATTELRQQLTLTSPRLWNGRADPYLYQVAVELRDGDRVVDRVVQPLGVRTFAFDADRGFILNGKPLRLHGVSRHQDRAGKGWALAPEDHAEDMATIAELGANTIRQAHYQHAQEWTEAADRAGMVVWAELPYTHETSVTHAPEPSPALVENAKAQLVELIRQNYNHPSIMIWAVGNEVDVGTLVNVRYMGSKGELSRPRAFLKELHELARREDDSRVTGYADCCEDAPIAMPGMEVLAGATSITAYNRYFGWYYGHPADFGKVLDAFHAKHPTQPIGVSEYGAGGAFSQHTDNPEGGPPSAMARPHPEEYQSWYHEESWKALQARPYLVGTWIWNMFDFAATNRAEGETVDVNDKGLVHHDHKQRKDVFYFYKANWSSEPVLHITGRRHVDRAYPVVDVRVYSNAPRATLTLNGKALGDAPCDGGICVWRAVKLASGDNVVEVRATVAGQSLRDSVTWRAPDAADGLRIMAGTLTGATTADGRRFGSDNFFVGGVGNPVVPFLIPNRQLKPVAGTDTPELYESYRAGAFRYELPLPDGDWTVTLHMAEFDEKKASSRRFDVTANGETVLRDFNPAEAAGGIFKALTREFPVSVKGEGLRLEFSAKEGEAIVSAITASRRPSR